MILQRHPRRRMLLILPPLAFGFVVLALMAGNRQPPVKERLEEPAKLVRTIEARQLDLIPMAEGYGSVQPAQVWTAVSEVSGRITALHPRLRDGEMIAAGSLLLSIDPVDYELNLAQAEAALAELDVETRNAKANLAIEQRNLKIAEREFDRVSKLAAKGTVSQSDLDTAERSLLNSRIAVQNIDNTLALQPTKQRVLEAKRSQAQRDLQNTRIVAPFDLRVANMQVETDQYISKGQSLLEGDSVDRVEVLAQFPLASLQRLFIGRGDGARVSEALLHDNLAELLQLQPLVRLDLGRSHAQWQARFVRFSDKVDAKTRTVGVVVAVDKPFEKVKPGERPPLTKGMFVQVLLRGKPLTGTIPVPRSAVRDNALYLVDGEQRLQRQPVTVLFSQGEISVIGDGLEAGRQVVVSDLIPAVVGMRLAPEPDQTLADEMLASVRGER
ncbi:MAG: efflux RND transporter periplasmic adaptor subunit [Candidatus Thiodiazotropha sp.]